jgi:hypothetical protein
MQHYVIKFVSELRQSGGFQQVLWFPPPINLTGAIEEYGVMMFNATFNNISDISRQSGLLVEETRVPAENHRSVATHYLLQLL